jgi:hypothetical protein
MTQIFISPKNVGGIFWTPGLNSKRIWIDFSKRYAQAVENKMR